MGGPVPVGFSPLPQEEEAASSFTCSAFMLWLRKRNAPGCSPLILELLCVKANPVCAQLYQGPVLPALMEEVLDGAQISLFLNLFLLFWLFLELQLRK